MSQKIIFKRLVLFNFLTAVFFLISPLLNIETEEVLNFNNSVEMNDIVFLIVILWLIAFTISSYMLYNFKKTGKQLYLIAIILGVIISLFNGSIAFDPISYLVDGLGWAFTGIIIYILYFTPIKKEFE
jgi:hypothetical protein